MSDMSLQAEMRLDGANMLSGLGNMQGALQGLAARFVPVIAAAAALAAGFEGVKKAISLGGELNDLSARTGIAVGELLVLRQAFDDTGVGAQSGVQAIALMQKALTGIGEDGEPTNAMFRKLGLSLESLKGMGTTEQLTTIGAAIRGLADPAERTAAAMALFGRSGAAMNQFFADPQALNTAKSSLGDMPALMQKNAAMMDNIGDMWGRVSTKLVGFFAGVFDKLGPLIEWITKAIEEIDFTTWGRAIGAIVEPFMLFIGLVAKAIAGVAKLFEGLLKLFQDDLKMPAVVETLRKDSGSKLGTDTSTRDKKDADAQQKYLDKERSMTIDALEGAKKINALEAERNRLIEEGAKLRAGSEESWKNKGALLDVDKEITQTKKAMEKGDSKGGSVNIATDQLARVGGFIGGGMGAADHGQKIAQNTEKTANNVEKLAKEMSEYRNLSNNLVWAE